MDALVLGQVVAGVGTHDVGAEPDQQPCALRGQFVGEVEYAQRCLRAGRGKVCRP
jgi:hypothetical protein